MTDEELKKAVEVLFGKEHEYQGLEVTITDNGQYKTVKVDKMYSHIDLTFEKTEALAVLFGTRNYTVDDWSSSGCETCDYGSSYVHTFTFLADKFVRRVDAIHREHGI